MKFNAKAVALDLGGVLADWQPSYLFDRIIPDPKRRAFFLDEVCGPSWLNQINLGCPFEIAISQRQADYPEWRDEIALYYTCWGKMIGGPISGMHKLLMDLRQLGTRLLLFTNHPAETFEITERKIPFLQSLDGVFISGQEGTAKPDASAFEAFLRKFGLTAPQTTLVDDELENVSTARRLGWDAILFVNSDQARMALSRCGLLRGFDY